MQIGTFGITNPFPTVVEAGAISEIVFEENFDTVLSGWNQTVCQASSPEQQCIMDTVTTIGVPPPSLPNWGRVGIIDGGFNCLPGSIKATFEKKFNVANEGDYMLSATMSGSGCDICDAFAKLFLDGVLKFNKKGRNTNVDGPGPPFVFAEQTTVHLTAGMHTIGIEGGVVPPDFFPFICSGFFGGFFDNIRIEKPECTPPPSGMISWWDGDAVSGTTAFDIQDANDGTLVNGATTAPDKVGQAFSFDGVDDYMNIGNPTNLNLAGDMTVDFWFRINSQKYNVLAAKGIGLEGNEWYVRQGAASGPGLEFAFQDTDSDVVIATSSSPIVTAVFYHLALVRDGTTGRLYLNGIQVASNTNPALGDISNPHNIIIGADNRLRSSLPSPFVNDFAAATIDEVEIYNRALSQAEIQALFNAGSAGKCKIPPDTNPPVITLLGDNPATVECGSPYVDAGATAFDEEDGDLTGLIQTSELPIDTSAVGSHTVTYDFGVVDAAGNAAEPVDRTVNVVDTTAPTVEIEILSLELVSASPIAVDLGMVTAFDNCDPTPTLINDAPSLFPIGTTIVTWTATDDSGNSATAEQSVTVLSLLSAFSAKVEVEIGDEGNDNDNDNNDNDNNDNDSNDDDRDVDELEAKGKFKLGTFSNGIDPASEPVTIKIGDFEITIPAVSFILKKSEYKFKGTVDGIPVEMNIKKLKKSEYEFKIETELVPLSLCGSSIVTTSPVEVMLTIGDDSGSASTKPEIDELENCNGGHDNDDDDNNDNDNDNDNNDD